MKLARRIFAMALALCMLIPVSASADSGSIISLGADLSQEQRDQMLAYLQPAQGEVARIVTVTNQEEKDLLGAFIPAEQIGSRSLSCSSVTLLETGKGISVTTNNITWCSALMYKSALITAGISDAAVVVTAPFQVSGTAALAGIYKAYEEAIGETLGEAAKAIAGEELALTGKLGELLGQEEAASMIAQLKEEVVSQGLDKPEHIRPAIVEAAKQFDIALSDEQIDMLTDLLLKLLKLDIDPAKLAEQADSIVKTLQGIQKAQETTTGFIESVQKGWNNLVGWLKGLFGGNR